MSMVQNEARTALPNVLHDQGIANTIGGIGPPTAPRRQLTRPIAVYVTAAGGLLALLAVLAVLLGRGT